MTRLLWSEDLERVRKRLCGHGGRRVAVRGKGRSKALGQQLPWCMVGTKRMEGREEVGRERGDRKAVQGLS